MSDPRRILETAAEQRCRCEVLPRQGRWQAGTIVRVERGGVAITVRGGAPASGTDLRVWLTVDGQPYTFEASVLRAGIPVPDRSQDGVLLGFIDGWRKVEREQGEVVLDVLPPNGGPVSLLGGAVRVVELSPNEWTVTAPAAFTLVFVEQGTVRLRLGLPDRAPMEVGARVHALSRGDGHLLYALRIESAEDPERYREMIRGLRELLGA